MLKRNDKLYISHVKVHKKLQKDKNSSLDNNLHMSAVHCKTFTSSRIKS